MSESIHRIEPIRFQGGEISSITEVVYVRLKHAIMTGAFAPGERLSERTIAKRLGTSTTPIKHAIHMLHIEGLLHVKPRSGTFVSDFDESSLQENSMIRARLEGLAARFAASKGEPSDAVAIEDRIEDMRKYTSKNDVAGMVEANTQFHLTIHDVARNPYLKRLLAVLREFDRSVRNRALDDQQEAKRGWAEHRRIADAIVAKDAALADQLMQQHILRTSEELNSRVIDSEK